MCVVDEVDAFGAGGDLLEPGRGEYGADPQEEVVLMVVHGREL
ncbi:hypothetical protein [Streptomyces sp. NPDC090036]